MDLKSLAYTSFARLDLTGDDLAAIHRTARDINAIEGVTGLLIYNGTHFLQIVEGAQDAIDSLVERLRRDPRHSGFEVRDERWIAERCFPEWSMELALVKSSYFEARDDIVERLPAGVPPEVRERLLAMTERISGTVEMPT
ncbi:MAG: BLUF domain-containing protein [Sphingomonas sp.]|nr:BLUF domain-containing protein [Sphingomonas sp.]